MPAVVTLILFVVIAGATTLIVAWALLVAQLPRSRIEPGSGTNSSSQTSVKRNVKEGSVPSTGPHSYYLMKERPTQGRSWSIIGAPRGGLGANLEASKAPRIL